jgi:YD repeat-containing protein
LRITEHAVAGSGAQNNLVGIPGPALGATLTSPGALAVSRSGELFIGTADHRVLRVDPGGDIDFYAGNGLGGPPGVGNPLGDGGPATAAYIARATGLTIGRDGSLYITSNNGFAASHRVRRVTPDGVVQTVLGNGVTGLAGSTGIGRPATGVSSDPIDVELSPDGKLLVIEAFDGRRLVWTLEPPLPQFAIGEYVIPSEDGAELYHFDSLGKHQETFDALTGATLLTFAYTPSGMLDTISDPHGNVTRVVRDGTGRPTGVEAPFGQVTQLRQTASGFLDKITNPAGEALSMVGSANGLISSLVAEGSATASLEHDPFGRITLREGPTGSFRQFNRTFDARGRGVTTFTAGGRLRGADVHRDLLGERGVVRTGFDHLPTAVTIRRDGTCGLRCPVLGAR